MLATAELRDLALAEQANEQPRAAAHSSVQLSPTDRLLLRLALVEHDGRLVRAARSLRCQPLNFELQRAVATLHRQVHELLEFYEAQDGIDVIGSVEWRAA